MTNKRVLDGKIRVIDHKTMSVKDDFRLTEEPEITAQHLEAKIEELEKAIHKMKLHNGVYKGGQLHGLHHAVSRSVEMLRSNS